MQENGLRGYVWGVQVTGKSTRRFEFSKRLPECKLVKWEDLHILSPALAEF